MRPLSEINPCFVSVLYAQRVFTKDLFLAPFVRAVQREVEFFALRPRQLGVEERFFSRKSKQTGYADCQQVIIFVNTRCTMIANGDWIADNQQVEELSVSCLIIFFAARREDAF